jgi:hypothetical protein
MSVNRASPNFSFSSWLIYVLIGRAHPFIKYWQHLLSKTTAECSLPHPKNERQQSVISCSCWIFCNQDVALIFAFRTELLTSMVGKNTNQPGKIPI